jgi:hypothetical protein
MMSTQQKGNRVAAWCGSADLGEAKLCSHLHHPQNSMHQVIKSGTGEEVRRSQGQGETSS